MELDREDTQNRIQIYPFYVLIKNEYEYIYPYVFIKYEFG
jgi:hypothetical protein